MEIGELGCANAALSCRVREWAREKGEGTGLQPRLLEAEACSTSVFWGSYVYLKIKKIQTKR